MEYITSDEVMQMEMQDIKDKISEISNCKVNKHIKDVDFIIGKCYEIVVTLSRRALVGETVTNAIFLERVENKLYFVTNGTGQIAIIERSNLYIDYNMRKRIVEDSTVNNAAILVIDLDLVNDSVYARELV